MTIWTVTGQEEQNKFLKFLNGLSVCTQECHVFKVILEMRGMKKEEEWYLLTTQSGFAWIFCLDFQFWGRVPFFTQEDPKMYPWPTTWGKRDTHPVCCIGFLANPEQNIWWHQHLGQTAALQPGQQLISPSENESSGVTSVRLPGQLAHLGNLKQKKAKPLLGASCSRVSFVFQLSTVWTRAQEQFCLNSKDIKTRGALIFICTTAKEKKHSVNVLPLYQR